MSDSNFNGYLLLIEIQFFMKQYVLIIKKQTCIRRDLYNSALFLKLIIVLTCIVINI